MDSFLKVLFWWGEECRKVACVHSHLESSCRDSQGAVGRKGSGVRDVLPPACLGFLSGNEAVYFSCKHP